MHIVSSVNSIISGAFQWPTGWGIWTAVGVGGSLAAITGLKVCQAGCRAIQGHKAEQPIAYDDGFGEDDLLGNARKQGPQRSLLGRLFGTPLHVSVRNEEED